MRGSLLSVQKESTFPVVTCPGCQTAMRALVTESISPDLHETMYRCEQCGTETLRIFKRPQETG
jgi:hypothetical protein